DEPVKSSSAMMQLLEERFDRRTGACRVLAGEPGATPVVHVRTMNSTESTGDDQGGPGVMANRSSERRRGASITAIAETIAHSAPLNHGAPAPPMAMPSYWDLDPVATLSSRAGRLDRLIRSTLRDPRWLGDEPPEAWLIGIAAQQTPVANAALIGEAAR